MADFAELGLEAVDHLLENHFDDIPDQVFHPRTALRGIRDRDRSKGSRFPILDRLEGRKEQTPVSDNKDDHRRESQDDSDIASDYSDGVYSQREGPSGPRTDPYYQEAQRRTNDYYAPPSDPPQRDPQYPARRRDPNAVNHTPPPHAYTWSSDPYSTYASRDAATHPYEPRTYSPPRPGSPPRRTRSQSDARGRRGPTRPKAKRRPSSTGPSQGLTDAFSTSDKGLGAGGLGALAGGFLAQEVERRTGRGNPMLLTLLGAAVGGLGANVLEGRMERRKKMKEAKDEREERRRRR